MDPIWQASANLLMALQIELGLDITDENFNDTPARMSRMYREILAGVHNTEGQVEALLASAFPCDNDQLILVKDIEVFSLCPHHFLPVRYNIHIAYLPSPEGKVIGLSKMPRLANILAKRPVLQEQLVNDIVEALMCIKGVRGAGCIASGEHFCMIMRGARQTHAKTIASSLRGAFLEESVKQEFLQLVQA